MSPYVFWDDLAVDLRDPECQRGYIDGSEFIAEVDAVTNAEALALAERVSGDDRYPS